MSDDPHPLETKPKGTLANHVGVLLFKLFEGIIKLLPVGFICRLGMAAGWLAWLLLPSRRRIVARNLRIVIDPALRGSGLDRLVRQNCIRSVMHMFASTKTATMSDRSLERHTRLIGPDVFDDPDTTRHGLICIVAHSGNWELLSRTYTFFPTAIRYGSMYRRMDNPLLEKYLYAKRTGNGAHMYSKEDGIAGPLAFIKSGGGLGILSDQFVQEGFYVPYFGKVTGTTYLPALVQKRTKAKMKPCVAAAGDRTGSWVCHTSNGLADGDIKGGMAETTIAVNRMLEEQIAKSPLDGFWMHHRWKVGEQFAPQDPKALKAIEGLELKPFRILFAPPREWEEAVFCVPMVKALKSCRRDMQLIVICPDNQLDWWKSFAEVSHVIASGSVRAIRQALYSDSIYREGPYDIAFLLDDSRDIPKALKPFQPVTFSGFSSHPCSHMRAFKTVAPPVSPGRMKHRVEDFLALLDKHAIPARHPDYFPSRKPDHAVDSPVLLSPFSSLGSANEWDECNWAALLTLLGGRKTALIALPEDSERVRGMAERLNVPVIANDLPGIQSALTEASCLIAVDGVLPSLAALAGIPCVTLFSTRLPARYRPLGSFHQSLHRHRACSPCFLRQCDQQTKCVNDITPVDAAQAYAAI